MKTHPPTSELQALSARRQLLRPDHAIRGIVFQAVERAVSETLGPRELDAVKRNAKIGGKTFDAMSKYPMLDFMNFQEAAAHALSPASGGFDEAIARIGAAAVDSFFGSIAGKTMALLAGRDPTRLLSAAPNGYGLLVTFGRREWKQTSERSGVFTFNEDYLGPLHTYGTFDAALRRANGIAANFDIDAQSPLDFALKVRW